MGKRLSYGRATYHYAADDDSASSPVPLFTLKSVIAAGGIHWRPRLKDRTVALLLKRRMPKEVSFCRAYAGWRESGHVEEKELGEDRAFLRWLQRRELGIAWAPGELKLHPYFTGPEAPRHDPDDETARGLSFAIRPVEVQGRRVKLYVGDADMFRLLGLAFGDEEDFLALVRSYVQERRRWEAWQAPAPLFVDWVQTQGKRARFERGQVGYYSPKLL